MSVSGVVQGDIPCSRCCRRAAAVLVLAVAFYLTVGHAVHAPAMPGAKAMHGLAFCIVLFTLVVVSVLPPRPLSAAAIPTAIAVPLELRPFACELVRSRASPVWLQRFRN